MLIAQLSDLHLIDPARGLGFAPALTWTVDLLNRFSRRPDLVLLTGDLADVAEPGAYADLRRLLTPLQAPVIAIPGNHDDRELLRAVFADQDWMPAAGFIQIGLDLGPLRVLALDSQRVGEVGGELCADRLAWLAHALDAAPGRPTLIALHHPPVPVGMPQLDRFGFGQAAALAALVGRHRQVIGVLAGHMHRALTVQFAGTVLHVAPSLACQFALPFAGNPRATRTREPGAFMLHNWDRGRLTSYTIPLGELGILPAAT